MAVVDLEGCGPGPQPSRSLSVIVATEGPDSKEVALSEFQHQFLRGLQHPKSETV
jgi:hypothetical protein